MAILCELYHMSCEIASNTETTVQKCSCGFMGGQNVSPDTCRAPSLCMPGTVPASLCWSVGEPLRQLVLLLPSSVSQCLGSRSARGGWHTLPWSSVSPVSFLISAGHMEFCSLACISPYRGQLEDKLGEAGELRSKATQGSPG